jgi:hypothetical protein
MEGLGYKPSLKHAHLTIAKLIPSFPNVFVSPKISFANERHVVYTIRGLKITISQTSA